MQIVASLNSVAVFFMTAVFFGLMAWESWRGIRQLLTAACIFLALLAYAILLRPLYGDLETGLGEQLFLVVRVVLEEAVRLGSFAFLLSFLRPHDQNLRQIAILSAFFIATYESYRTIIGLNSLALLRLQHPDATIQIPAPEPMTEAVLGAPGMSLAFGAFLASKVLGHFMFGYLGILSLQSKQYIVLVCLIAAHAIHNAMIGHVYPQIENGSGQLLLLFGGIVFAYSVIWFGLRKVLPKTGLAKGA
ncbi:MAG: hypothetical protein JJ873_16210 [Maricaulis sp.]|uniref:hypothetical protein n=1 Tax=Maricaulis sp. TaxID=1486257 RepID=UPI001B2D9385|nr:hypothetical protein [Maricaulis sp.]MBO6878926.1 hypothetical protein [Maricaulis sp.]